MIDYTKVSKINVQSAVEKLSKDLMSNNRGAPGAVDVKRNFTGKLKIQ